MKKNSLPIGIFDSGVGGLTVLEQLIKVLPNENFIYFGDTDHVPYGNKSKETIKGYCKEIVSFLDKQSVKLIIVACNTASSTALDVLCNQTKTPILNVIDPCVEQAVKTTKNNFIGVIGTKTTILSQAYKDRIKKTNSKINVYGKACSLFVPIIEESLVNNKIADEIVKFYLKDLPLKIDTLILGCTHYPLIKHIIKKELSSNVNILDSSVITAKHVGSFLKNGKLLNPSRIKSKTLFFVSDDKEKFNFTIKKIMSNCNYEINKISL